ncbi:hypothetical protein TWF481_011093 [Arthrobotrys musiformis]|uniref:Sec39 domain-containing protein n=1 Tax=Arthrobotrys musiformis TaxID=47236 RepID=A0AAV9VZ55_9PEZI
MEDTTEPIEERLTRSRAILLSLYFASRGEVESLRGVFCGYGEFLREVGGEVLVGYLPESLPVSSYAGLMREWFGGDVRGGKVDGAYVADIDEESAGRTLEGIGFPRGIGRGVLEVVRERVWVIDGATGDLGVMRELVGEFGDDGGVREWDEGVFGVFEGVVLRGGEVGIKAFEGMEGREGVRLILGGVLGDVNGGMGGLGGYIGYKGCEEAGWGWVCEWMEGLGWEDLWRVVMEWETPRGEWGRVVMRRCYSSSSSAEVARMGDMLRKLVGVMKIDVNAVTDEEVERFVERSAGSPRYLEELTTPSPVTIKLLQGFIVSVEKFAGFPLKTSVKEVMRMKFFGSRGDQIGLLKRALAGGKGRSEGWYREVRGVCEYLRVTSGVFGRLAGEDVEGEVLKDMLAAGRFAAVTTTYVKGKLLPREVVEKAVLHSVIDFYDNATNGNKLRGGMKNAFNSLSIIYPTISTSPPLRRLSRLIEATHALSEYSLTLTPGVPLKPVQIRLHPQPLEILSRVLQSNPKAYLQLPSLIKIATDLVDGVSQHEDEMDESEVVRIKRTVVGMCIEAALAEDDFETAVSYVVNKLVPGYTPVGGDTAWQAALQTGRYRSPSMLAESMEGVATARGIERLNKRMEVLSQAMIICPVEAVMDVVRTWKGCEDELERLLELEVQEEERHAGLGWVGGISKATGGGLLKAPMSLLGVASSAGGLVKGLGGSAFPLRGSRQDDGRSSGEFERGEDGERVRKRDVISGMVTSGLASGIGWMLGAKVEDMNAK